MKVAIVHEWLVTYAGSEKVLEQILICYPDADIFALVDFLESKDRRFLNNRPVKTSFIQKLPFAKKYFRNYLALMPIAIEQFDLSKYDLIITSAHAVAKGVITGPDQLHVSYVHSPIRYAWDLQHQYLGESNLNGGLKSIYVRWVLHKLRLWDVRTSFGVDYFVANSKFIGRRIRKVYRRDADVIYPPVNTLAFAIKEIKSDFYVTASRLVPYKRVDLIVEAFASMPDKRLVVIGAGPDFDKIKRIATSNVSMLGFVEDEKLIELLSNAKAFVFAAEEDFGILPVEAQACGTPVIAFGRGGACETVVTSGASATGVLFSKQSASCIAAAVHEFEDRLGEFTSANCRANAERFSNERFGNEFFNYVKEKYQRFCADF